MMACVHLQQLYRLCLEHHLKLSGSDLIHVVCRQCGAHEVCPSALLEEDVAGDFSSVDNTTSDPQGSVAKCPRQEP